MWRHPQLSDALLGDAGYEYDTFLGAAPGQDFTVERVQKKFREVAAGRRAMNKQDPDADVYEAVNVSGVLDEATQRAIRLVQQRYGRVQTGAIDAWLLYTVMQFPSTVKYPDPVPGASSSAPAAKKTNTPPAKKPAAAAAAPARKPAPPTSSPPSSAGGGSVGLALAGAAAAFFGVRALRRRGRASSP